MRNIVFLFMLLMYSNANAQERKKDWIYIGESEVSHKVYVSSRLVSNENGKKYVWTKWLIPKKVIENITYTNVESKELIGVDCMSKKLSIKKVITYSSSGEMLQNLNMPNRFKNVDTGAINEIVLLVVCDLFK